MKVIKRLDYTEIETLNQILGLHSVIYNYLSLGERRFTTYMKPLKGSNAQTNQLKCHAQITRIYHATVAYECTNRVMGTDFESAFPHTNLLPNYFNSYVPSNSLLSFK